MGIKQYFSEPSELRRLKELLYPRLLPFTLWLAILSFSSSILFTAKWEQFQWIFSVVFKMNNDILAQNLHYWIIIIVFSVLTGVSGLMCLILGLTWVVTNIIRGMIGLVNKFKHKKQEPLVTKDQPQAKPYTKLDIHLETNDNSLADSIRKLSDTISKKKGEDT